MHANVRRYLLSVDFRGLAGTDGTSFTPFYVLPLRMALSVEPVIGEINHILSPASRR